MERVSVAEELVPLPGSTSALEDGGSLLQVDVLLSVYWAVPRNPRQIQKS